MGRDFKTNLNNDLDLIGGVTVVKAYFDNQPEFLPQWFRPATVEALEQIKGVVRVSSVGNRGLKIMRHNKPHYIQMLAVDEAFWEVRSFWAIKGTLFGKEAIQGRKLVCVLGETAAQKIFGTLDVVGQTLEIDLDVYRVVAVLGGITVSAVNNAIFIPVTTAQDRLAGNLLVDLVYVRCETWDDVGYVASRIPKAVRTHQSADRLQVDVAWEGLKRVRRVVWWSEFFIYIALAATLILGGIGIWNVMMAAVRSRTREIGLKKAMGAEDKDILAQFLTESLTVSLSAAVLGIILGRAIIELMGLLIGQRPQEDLFFLCMILGILFGVILGVGAGLYPSLQASRMEVVSATRYE